MRRLLAGMALVLATTASLTACGGPPEDAAEDDFCETIRANPVQRDGAVDQEAWDRWVEDVKDTGTPEGIPEDARAGFEASVDLLEDVEVGAGGDALFGQMEEAESRLDDEEKAAIDRFDDYVTETCGRNGSAK